MQKAGKRISPKINYDIGDRVIEINQDEIKEAKPFFNSSIVGTVMRGFKIEASKQLPNVPIYFQNTVKYGNAHANKLIGPYFLKDLPTFNADSKTFSHVLYDNFITTMVDYKQLNISYPTTVLNYFQQLCLACGFTTNITSLPNGDKVIDHDIYKDIGFTYRDIYEDIGQATGTLFSVNNNVVEKCSFSQNKIVINDDLLKNKNISIGEHVGPINSIILSRSADSDYIYKRDETLTKWNEFWIKDNILMNGNNRDEFLEDLYQTLNGIEYDTFDLELVGYGGFDPLQKIEIH